MATLLINVTFSTKNKLKQSYDSTSNLNLKKNHFLRSMNKYDPLYV